MIKNLLFIFFIFLSQSAFSQGQENNFTNENVDEEVEQNAFHESTSSFENNWQASHRQNFSASSQQLQGNWFPLGPTNIDSVYGSNAGIGRIGAVAVAQTDNSVIYVGSTNTGLWKSTDGGGSWVPKTDAFASHGIYYIAIDPTNATIVYILTYNKLLKSNDGGNTWNQLPLSDNATSSSDYGDHKILIDPLNPQIIYLSGYYQLYKSLDAGNSWMQLSNRTGKDIQFKPGNPNTLYSCNGNKFYKSTDGGISFDSLTLWATYLEASVNFGLLEIGVTPADTNYIYILELSGRIFRSTNGGNSFSEISGVNCVSAGGGGMHHFAVSPLHKELLIKGCTFYGRSTDAGSSWYNTISYLHIDNRFVSYFGNTLWIGCDGGVLKSDDDGLTFTDKSKGLNIEILEGIGSSQTDSSVYMCGGWDNGCMFYSNGYWKNVDTEDGFGVTVDPTNSQIIYTQSQHGVRRSMNGGLTRTPIAGLWSYFHKAPLVINPQNSGTIYYAHENVYKSIDRGSHWDTLSNFPYNWPDYLSFLLVAPNDSNIIYTGGGGTFIGSFYRTVDGGVTWDSLRPMVCLTIDPNNPNRIWGVDRQFSNSSENSYHVNYSSDGGNTWQQLTTNGLPNAGITCIEYENNGRDGLYIATSAGIFYIDNTLNTWQPFDSGLPNVQISDFEMNNNFHFIRAGTFGRGMWQSPLFVPNQRPVADFSSDVVTVCPGEPIKYIDLCLNNGPSYSPIYHWEFQGGSPSISSNSNPVITYNTPGVYYVKLTISNMNGVDSTEIHSYVNVVSDVPVPAPLSEGFDTIFFPPTNWISVVRDSLDRNWSQAFQPNQNSGSYGNTAGCAKIQINQIAYQNLHYNLLSPHCDLTSLNNPALSFDYIRPSGFTYGDTLKVFYSFDCGITRHYFFQKQDSDLTNQWKTESVLLPSIPFLNNVQFGFEFISNYYYSDNLFSLDEINIKSAQPPTANFTSDKTKICRGDTIHFADISLFDGPSFSPVIQWYFPGGTPNTSSDLHPVISYNTAGVYDAQLIVLTSFGTDTLIIHNYITVGLPIPPFSIIQNYDTLFAPQGFQNYHWTRNQNTLQLPNYYTLIQHGAAIYNVTVTDNNGCSLSVSDTVTTTYPVALFIGSQTTLCAGNYATFDNFSFNATTYKWIFNGGSPSISTSITPGAISYNLPGSYDVTLIAYGAGTNDTLILHNYVHVSPNPLPFTITQSNDTLFAPQGFAGYQWNNFNYPIYNLTMPINGAIQSDLIVSQNGAYLVTVEDSNGCISADTISISNLPTIASFTSTDSVICDGSCVNFSNLSHNANNYQWIFSGATPLTSSVTNPQNICYNLPGNYDVTLIASDSSHTDTLTLHNYILVSSLPSFSINQVSNTLFAPPGFSTYQWYLNGNLIPGATDYFYAAIQNGTYSVIVNDNNNCEGSDSLVVTNVGIIEYTDSEPGLSVFPNPTTGDFMIVLKSAKAIPTKIELLNTLNQIVYFKELKTVLGENKIEVPNQNITGGIYFLKIFDGTKILARKIEIKHL